VVDDAELFGCDEIICAGDAHPRPVLPRRRDIFVPAAVDQIVRALERDHARILTSGRVPRLRRREQRPVRVEEHRAVRRQPGGARLIHRIVRLGRRIELGPPLGIAVDHVHDVADQGHAGVKFGDGVGLIISGAKHDTQAIELQHSSSLRLL